MKYNKGFTPTIILVIILGFLVVGGVAYFVGKSSTPKNKVVDNSNYTTSATNNNSLTQIPSPAPTCNPSLTVLSPNGGEVYKAGDKITVKWNSCNFSSSSNDIVVALHQNGEWDNVIYLSGATINDGSEIFTIPTNIKVGNYKIRVGSVEAKVEQDFSDNLFKINVNKDNVNLSTFSSQYITPNYSPDPWPPIVRHNTTAYSCSTISRDVFGTLTTLTGKQNNINGRDFCKYEFSDGGAGSFSGVYTYITAELNGSGTERVDFRSSWHSCGVYGTTGDSQYDKCKNDQSTFFNNLDVYIVSLM